MRAPSTAPQTLRVISRPIKAPKNMPFQAIRVDLSARPATIADLQPAMVAVGRPRTHGTVFAIAAAIRDAHPQPEEDSPGKGARYLRCRCGASAHRHHRSIVGVRCGAAGSDSLQGRGADANLLVLVRPRRATWCPTTSPGCDVEDVSATRGARAAGRPRHGGEEAERRCRSKRWCAAI
jgi:hypothetical protein